MTMTGTLMALPRRDGATSQGFRSRPDALISIAVQICAAPMAIRRKSFYGPAVQASLST